MNPRSDSNAGPRGVVIVDPGFAGLALARASAPADTRVIDRDHYNLFQPLPIAFLLWGAVRTFLLIGFGNRVAVFLNWVWAWLTYGAARDRSLARSGGGRLASDQPDYMVGATWFVDAE
jgi:NADH dehydrogenase FAD-containing subunit